MDPHILDALQRSRDGLREAPERYGRRLGPPEYWWLGTLLAAAILAELGGESRLGDRIQAVADRIGLLGPSEAAVSDAIDLLAAQGSLGMLWPLYERRNGRWERTETPLAPAFGPEEAYWLALAHVATARLLQQGEPERIPALARALGELVTGGLEPWQEAAILAALSPEGRGP